MKRWFYIGGFSGSLKKLSGAVSSVLGGGGKDLVEAVEGPKDLSDDLSLLLKENRAGFARLVEELSSMAEGGRAAFLGIDRVVAGLEGKMKPLAGFLKTVPVFALCASRYTLDLWPVLQASVYPFSRCEVDSMDPFSLRKGWRSHRFWF